MSASRELQCTRRESEESLQAADARLSEFRVRGAEAKEKAESIRSNLGNKVDLRETLTAQLGERKARIAEMGRKALEMGAAREQSKARVEALRGRLERLEEEVAARQEEYHGLSARVREVEEAVHLIRPDIDARQDDKQRLQLSKSEKSHGARLPG